MRSFVHFMLSSLNLSGVGTLNKLIPLSFLEVLHTFFKDNKVTSQTPLKITDAGSEV